MSKDTLRSLVKGFWTICDSVFVDNGKGEVEIIKEGVGVMSDGVDVGFLVAVELGDGVELDEFKIEKSGGKGLGRRIRAITATTKEVASAGEAVALSRKEVVVRDERSSDALFCEGLLSVSFFCLSSLGQTRHNGFTVFDECPVGSIDAILAVMRCGDLNNFYAGLAKTFDEGLMFLLGFGMVDGNI